MILDGLSPKQIEAVNTIDEDLQIIACAGAGKTGVVTRRVINILKTKSDIKPENIVSFTFTKKAAEELKSRIYSLGKEVLGNTTGFANMYIGTIHGFCLNMLQENIISFQNFSVLDDIKANLFIDRYYKEVGMEDLGLKRYVETKLFMSVMGLLNENPEDSNKWNEEVRTAFEKYKEKLYAEKFFDYSLILREMIEQLENNKKFRKVVSEKIKYLTVDEYQDINPVQEKLIRILKDLGANLCVVGDDDQTIYQFRGSDATNILTFVQRYDIKKYIILDKDYRSTEGIVGVAKAVIRNNNRRLPKVIESGCKTPYDNGDISFRECNTHEDEAEYIADNIEKLHKIGVPYSEMAVLLRKRKINSIIAEVFEKHDIPFVVEGVNELMATTECRAAKGIFEYLDGQLDMTSLFSLWDSVDYPFNKKLLANAIQTVATIDVTALKNYPDLNLQKVYQDFLKEIELIEDGRNQTEAILYNLGTFSQVIQDFELINFTVKPTYKVHNFCQFLKYAASESYAEGRLNNSYIRPDAVPIMTVHQSKGLEFAAVFIPGLNKNFFPAQKVGGKGIWHVIERSWIPGSSRFDSDIEDERKLFYVAVTRAKKYLFITRPTQEHDKKVSTFFEEAKDSPYMLPYNYKTEYSPEHLPNMKRDSQQLTLNFSLLEDYFECPYRFKLSMFYGFVQPMESGIGYGNTLHDIVRNINLAAINGEKITKKFVDETFESLFYLPYAAPFEIESMRKSAKRAVDQYVQAIKGKENDIYYAESPIEIDIGDGVNVNGRIDMVRSEKINGEEQVVIVDFKTANKRVLDNIKKEQLRIYALGYQHLTGENADYMEIYQLNSQNTAHEKINQEILTNIETEIKDAAKNIRSNNLPKHCNKETCMKCNVKHLCLNKKLQKEYK